MTLSTPTSLPRPKWMKPLALQNFPSPSTSMILKEKQPKPLYINQNSILQKIKPPDIGRL